MKVNVNGKWVDQSSFVCGLFLKPKRRKRQAVTVAFGGR